MANEDKIAQHGDNDAEVNEVHLEDKDGVLAGIGIKFSKSGIELKPQPSEDPQDPLNWSNTRKLWALVAVSWVSAQGSYATSINSGSLFQQGLYFGGYSPQVMSYSITTVVALLAVGPLFWVPVSLKIGKRPVYFYSVIGSTFMLLWNALSQSYGSFIAGCAMHGFFISAGSAVGAASIRDMYFLHDRGRKISWWTAAILSGSSLAPLLGGCIQYATGRWQDPYWLAFGISVISIPMVMFWIPESAWDRESEMAMGSAAARPDRSTWSFWWKSLIGLERVTTYHGSAFRLIMQPIRIMFSPLSLVAGIYLCIIFGWSVGMVGLEPIFLENPASEGGYGFNALAGGLIYFGFLLGAWAGALVTHPFIDRVNFYFIRRNKGIVKPEYRLHCLWPTLPLLSIALGIFGACLQYNLHWIGIAIANFIYQASIVLATAATTTYVVENFLDASGSASLAMNFWR